MERMIKVSRLGTDEFRVVTVQEAKTILEQTYNDSMGGIVADAKTREVISNIGPDVDEIIIIEGMMGGG
jgi:hypothetical protein